MNNENTGDSRNSGPALETVEQNVQTGADMQLWTNVSRHFLRRADSYSPLEHVRVLKKSTMPKVGLRARLAIPVLKDFDVTSRIAAPVVSEPVPAVVGTWARRAAVNECQVSRYAAHLQ